MKLSDFDYNLPKEKIAQKPAEPRDSAKLLVVDKNNGQIVDKIFSDIIDLIDTDTVIVINETRVIPARLKGRIQDTEIPCEIFLHKHIEDDTWDCLVYPGKKLKPGKKVHFFDPSNDEKIMTATIDGISHKGRIVSFGGLSKEKLIEKIQLIGETPLPPYIKENYSDSERYQTVYNNQAKKGSVAAPTAGLHFTPELITKLKNKGVDFVTVNLEVGLGTFASVETENILEHHMHSEKISLSKENAERLNTAKQNGKKILAVGTTSVRVLESFADDNGKISYGEKETEIFIYPGYTWKIVDELITNFHLPKSTLLMLVSSFLGYEETKKAYDYAVENDYRFFSFGDAMYIKM